MELIIVTGLSGAGKSCVINTLEDIGYFCVDNLPLELIPVFVKLFKESGVRKKVAVVTDIRAGLNVNGLKSVSALLKELSVSFKILFLDCSNESLLARYKQTRRSHPLMNAETDIISDAIISERKLLSDIRDVSDYIIDTTDLSSSACKARIISMFSDNSDKQMHIHCLSFGFKHGIPRDADYVFDVRFLPNPFYVPELKELTGLDESVRSFVMGNSSAVRFEKELHSLFSVIIPECLKEGRSQLVVAIGCTGGHHRSVTFAERLSKMLNDKGYNVGVTHRDVKK